MARAKKRWAAAVVLGAVGTGVAALPGTDPNVVKWTYSAPEGESVNLESLAGHDLDGDDVPDFVFAESTGDGVVVAISGRDGSDIWRVTMEETDPQRPPRVFRWGAALDWVGDVDDDGVTDVLVGAPNRGGKIGTLPPGEVRIVSGKTGADLLEVRGDAQLEYFGDSVCGLGGDANGDNIPDFAVGIPGVVGTSWGGVRAFSGADGTPLPGLRIDGEWDREGLGTAVCGLGDVNGDGKADFAAGAPGFLGPQAAAGRVMVFSGAGDGPIHAIAGKRGQFIGNAIANVGDVDQDGVDDLGIGVNAHFPPNDVMHVYSGKSGKRIVRIKNPFGHGTYPQAICAAGDVNGDGVPDIAIQDPEGTGQDLDEGAVYVLSGSKLHKKAPVLFAYCGTQQFEFVGSGIAPAGDVNADGVPDLLVTGNRTGTFDQEYRTIAVEPMVLTPPPSLSLKLGAVFRSVGAASGTKAKGALKVTAKNGQLKVKFKFAKLPAVGPFELWVEDGVGTGTLGKVGDVTGTGGSLSFTSTGGLPAELATGDPGALGGRRMELRDPQGNVVMSANFPHATADPKVKLTFPGTLPGTPPVAGATAELKYQAVAKKGTQRFDLKLKGVPKTTPLVLQRAFPVGSDTFETIGTLTNGKLRMDSGKGVDLPDDVGSLADLLGFPFRVADVSGVDVVTFFTWPTLATFQPRPDLIVTKIRFDYQPLGDTFRVRVDVMNQGGADTGPVNLTVDVFFPDSAPGAGDGAVLRATSRTTVGFPAGHEEEKLVVGFVSNPDAGNRPTPITVVATVDKPAQLGGTGEYLETSETNNGSLEPFVYDPNEDDYDRQ